MKVVIDTNSLLALVRYYLPFDKDGNLKSLIKNKIDSGEIIILDKVIEESKRVAKGLIIEKLEFLKAKNIQYKTQDLLPNQKFFNQLENSLCYGSQKNRLSEIEFDKLKEDYLNSADVKLILFCLQDKNTLELDNPVLITEETSSGAYSCDCGHPFLT